jgi:hypothetical protein
MTISEMNSRLRALAPAQKAQWKPPFKQLLNTKRSGVTLASAFDDLIHCVRRSDGGASAQLLNEKLPGSPCGYADGCFRISAKACKRVESAGLFAVAALCSNDGAMLPNFASLLLLRCELCAL